MQCVCVFALLAAGLWAQTGQPERKPDNVGVTVWVREDVFAGLMGNDQKRNETARRKLAVILDANPLNASALVWRGSVELTSAVYSRENADEQAYHDLLRRAEASFEQASRLAPTSSGVQAVIGVSWSTLAERLPEDLRSTAYRRAYEAWRLDRQFIGDHFHETPEHVRGELLAALAQGSARLGLEQETRTYLQEMAVELPGTPFEARAKRALERPSLLLHSPSCQSCHEPGRLASKLVTQSK